MNPNRVIWIDGNLSVATADDIGTIASPVILVVTGNITFTASATIYGVVYGARSSVATPAFGITGPGVIRGAVIAEHGLVGTSAPIVQYDKGLVDLLRYTSGSMVLVPGSWRDFPEGS